jgi:hypothetical protein
MTRVLLKKKDGTFQHYHVRMTRAWKEKHLKSAKGWLPAERVVAPPEKARLYRTTIVRTYYSTISGRGYSAGHEVADFRIERVSVYPISKAEMAELDKQLNRTEWSMKSIFMAKRKGSLDFKVTGFEENVMIDVDESKIGIRREVSFSGGKYVYDDSQLERIDRQRSEGYVKYKDKKRELDKDQRRLE